MTSKKRIWHKGKPPHVGWWCVPGEQDLWRWWDGKKWSIPINKDRQADSAGRCARITGEYEWGWCYHWPENARVARINPKTGAVTGAGPWPIEPSIWLAVGGWAGKGVAAPNCDQIIEGASNG